MRHNSKLYYEKNKPVIRQKALEKYRADPRFQDARAQYAAEYRKRMTEQHPDYLDRQRAYCRNRTLIRKQDPVAYAAELAARAKAARTRYATDAEYREGRKASARKHAQNNPPTPEQKARRAENRRKRLADPVKRERYLQYQREWRQKEASQTTAPSTCPNS